MRKHRRRILTLVATFYVAAAALSQAGAPGLVGFAAMVFALGLAWRAGNESAPPLGAGASFACAIALASVCGGAAAPPFVHIAGDMALLAGLGLAHLTVARLQAPQSLAEALAKPAPLTALVPVSLGAVGFTSWAADGSHPVLGGWLVAAAASVAVFALIELARRRFELGLRARILGAFSGLAAGIAIAFAASMVLRSGFGDVAVRAGVAPGALLATLVALSASELRLARNVRLVVVLVVLGGGIVLLSIDVSLRGPRDAATASAIFGVLALLAGTFAPRLADALRPEKGAWLDAIERAESSLLRSDADEAVRDALLCLRLPAGPHATSPELWTFDPVRMLRIDAAGYAHEAEALYPTDVVAAAAMEPEATLRTEVLEQLDVRRPDLRPALRWLSDRTALAATVITEAGEPRGLLVIPAGGRHDVMTLEEVTALKRLADRFASIAGFRAAIARGLERERDLAARIESLEDRALALEHQQAREVARHERATVRLARPATVGLYAPSSRLAYEALEAKTRVGAPLFVRHPSGIDPVPYVARAHLSGARSKGPLVIVEGTAGREHERERWADKTVSPLALADRGVLLLVDGAALPHDIQRLVAQALAEKRAPWERAEPLDVLIAITAVASPEALVESGRLDPALAARLGDAMTSPITLPSLAERPEDLRALLTDRLAREGLRARGEPVALSDGALGALVEYDFPGDETELSALVVRLVAVASGSIVRAEDVISLGLPRRKAD